MTSPPKDEAETFKYLEKLEYNKILEILSGFAVTTIGKDLALSLKPTSDIDTARKKMCETTEGHILLYRNLHIFQYSTGSP